MFKRVEKRVEDCVTIYLDGLPIEACAGESVAAALLAHGVSHTRTTPVSGSPRAPFCLMGVCYECLVIIDGQPNMRACRELVHAGMKVERQSGAGILTKMKDQPK